MVDDIYQRLADKYGVSRSKIKALAFPILYDIHVRDLETELDKVFDYHEPTIAQYMEDGFYGSEES